MKTVLRPLNWLGLLSLLIALVPANSRAQAPNLSWSTNVGGTLFAADASGNTYATSGGKVIIINSSGQAVQTNTICNLPGIARRDSSGNYYFTGTFDGTNDFGGISLVGGCTMCSNGKWAPDYPSGFIAKYSSAGALQWVTRFGPNGLINQISSIALDDAGNAYVGYRASGQAIVGIFNSSGTALQNVTIDPFVAVSFATMVGGVTSSNCAVFTYTFSGSAAAYRVSLAGTKALAGPFPMQWRPNTSSNAIPVIDDFGSIFQVGQCFDPISDPSCSAQKLRKCGPGSTEIWSLPVSLDAQWTLNRDAQANVYLAGSNGMLAKFNNDGSQVWSNNFSNPIYRMEVNSAGSRFISFANGTVARLDDEAGGSTAVIGMQVQTASLLESAGPAIISVTRSGNTSGSASVDYATSAGSGTAGVDYTTTSGTITFTNGQTIAAISVPILNNLTVQSSRTFNINLSNWSVGAASGIYSNTTVTILDDDSTLRFAATNFTFRESIATCKIPVIREGYSGNTVSADYSIADGTAVRSADYDVANLTGTLTFSSGVTTQYLTITNLDDGITESDETVLLSLSNPTGQSQLGTPASATMTIFDNERVQVVTNATESALRAALATGSPIVFDCDGTITLTSALEFTDETSIDGSGHSITLSGGGTTRLITTSPGANVTLKYLTIADGYDTNTFGGTGAISSQGKLTVIGCTFSNNVSLLAPDAAGAIRQLNAGAYLTVSDSTFVRNRGTGGAGAIDTAFSSFTYGVQVSNCTFYANSGYSGAALVREPIAHPSSFVNCTFAWNTNQSATVIESYLLIPTAYRLQVMNCIFASNVGGVEGSGFWDGGHNMTTDSSAVFTNSTTYKNTDALLGPLADNGGYTWTMALSNSSPAINTADTAAAPATDQRGLLRPYGANSDIGAYEWAPEFIVQGRVTGTMLTNQVTVSINGTTMTTTNGWFSLKNLSAGSYTITPIDSNYVFVPTNRTVTVGPNKLNANFSAYQRNSLSLDSLSRGLVNLVYAGTNAQKVRVLISTDGSTWTPIQTNNIGTNNVLEIQSPAESSVQLYRVERIQ